MSELFVCVCFCLLLRAYEFLFSLEIRTSKHITVSKLTVAYTQKWGNYTFVLSIDAPSTFCKIYTLFRCHSVHNFCSCHNNKGKPDPFCDTHKRTNHCSYGCHPIVVVIIIIIFLFFTLRYELFYRWAVSEWESEREWRGFKIENHLCVRACVCLLHYFMERLFLLSLSLPLSLTRFFCFVFYLFPFILLCVAMRESKVLFRPQALLARAREPTLQIVIVKSVELLWLKEKYFTTLFIVMAQALLVHA